MLFWQKKGLRAHMGGGPLSPKKTEIEEILTKADRYFKPGDLSLRPGRHLRQKGNFCKPIH